MPRWEQVRHRNHYIEGLATHIKNYPALLHGRWPKGSFPLQIETTSEVYVGDFGLHDS